MDVHISRDTIRNLRHMLQIAHAEEFACATVVNLRFGPVMVKETFLYLSGMLRKQNH